MKTIAVIGFGCAGYSAALAARRALPDAAIHIYSDTEEAPYNPMLTTYYVSGKIEEKAMFPMGDLCVGKNTLQPANVRAVRFPRTASAL